MALQSSKAVAGHVKEKSEGTFEQSDQLKLRLLSLTNHGQGLRAEVVFFFDKWSNYWEII